MERWIKITPRMFYLKVEFNELVWYTCECISVCQDHGFLLNCKVTLRIEKVTF